MTESKRCFSKQILKWFDKHGRHDLPWQKNRNAYRVWVAEIMLQQTQVKTVIPYYQNFLKVFPTVSSLATASLDEVLSHWAGLGYYSRARNLHKAAEVIIEFHQGKFPQYYDDVLALPGIGPSTAGAILAQAFNQQHAILDGNVKRVLSRFHAIDGWSGRSAISQRLWEKARQHTPDKRVDDYTQAIMDLGATLCVRSKPLCVSCPLNLDCEAYLSDCVALYPTKKPKKVIPVKQIQMLIIKNSAGAVLLEKRPPSGIWGGLWSLPEVDIGDDVTNYCASEWSLSAEHDKQGEPFRHTFSHYHLDITPCWINTDGEMGQIGEQKELVWCDTKNLHKVGVPKPVASLLDQTFA